MSTTMSNNNDSLLTDSTTPSGSLTDAASELAAPLEFEADRLRGVASQIEAFLMRQVDRLESELAQSMSNTADPTRPVTEEWAEFERTKARWDEERRQETARLHEESQRLLDAWGKLEHEQRELLKQRLPGKMSSSGSAPPANPAAARSDASMSPTSNENRSPADPVNGAAARNQFQQLRREMMDHARQRRKT